MSKYHHFAKDSLPLAGKTTFRSQMAAAAAAAVVDPASIITAGLH